MTLSHRVSPTPEAPEPEEVRCLFDRLAGRYDRFNRIASLGLDCRWRVRLVRSVAESLKSPGVILDFGTGTGDLIFEMVRDRSDLLKESTFIGMDVSTAMLELARLKIGERDRIYWLQGSALSVPRDPGSLDAAVSAFVLRNVRKDLRNVLSEMKRVLKPGGGLFLLEMGVPVSPALRLLHGFYLKTVLPWIGRRVFGRDWSGDYLERTVLGFESPERFSRLLEETGFRDAGYRLLDGGIAVLHTAFKPVEKDHFK